MFTVKYFYFLGAESSLEGPLKGAAKTGIKRNGIHSTKGSLIFANFVSINLLLYHFISMPILLLLFFPYYNMLLYFLGAGAN